MRYYYDIVANGDPVDGTHHRQRSHTLSGLYYKRELAPAARRTETFHTLIIEELAAHYLQLHASGKLVSAYVAPVIRAAYLKSAALQVTDHSRGAVARSELFRELYRRGDANLFIFIQSDSFYVEREFAHLRLGDIEREYIAVGIGGLARSAVLDARRYPLLEKVTLRRQIAYGSIGNIYTVGAIVNHTDGTVDTGKLYLHRLDGRVGHKVDSDLARERQIVVRLLMRHRHFLQPRHRHAIRRRKLYQLATVDDGIHRESILPDETDFTTARKILLELTRYANTLGIKDIVGHILDAILTACRIAHCIRRRTAIVYLADFIAKFVEFEIQRQILIRY